MSGPFPRVMRCKRADRVKFVCKAVEVPIHRLSQMEPDVDLSGEAGGREPDATHEMEMDMCG